MTAPVLIAVDWGSSNRRIFGLAADGAVLWREADDRGVFALDADAVSGEADAIVSRAEGAFVLMAGMVGSDRGWRPAPYAPCPAGPEELAAALVRPRANVAIVPGVSVSAAHADVMRGEETQAIGAVAAGLVPEDGLVCLPGTHAKWVRLERGRIVDFRTVMTGELFGHLRSAGALSAMIRAGDAAADAPFREGVAYALAHDDLLRELFHARARVLLGRADSGTVAGYVSGLLIGEELRINRDQLGRRLPLIGAPAITARYAVALEVAGGRGVQIDGEQAFLAGMRALAERAR